jgi:hypothetical protein
VSKTAGSHPDIPEVVEQYRATRGALGFAIVVLTVCVGAVVMALDFTGRASTAPLTVGLPAVAMAVAIVVRDALAFRNARVALGDDHQGGEPLTERLRANPYTWLVLFVVAFFALGALGSLVVFGVALIRLRAALPWNRALAVTGGSALALFLIAEVGLGEHLYRGLFF